MTVKIKFEKQFPNLKKTRAITLWNSGDYTFDKDIGRDDDTAFLIKDIKKNCVDKNLIADELTKEINRFAEELQYSRNEHTDCHRYKIYEIIKSLRN